MKLWGKGWLRGTQAHLDFVPERTTDFIFSVYAEEFGLVGTGILLALYTAFIARGLMIASQAQSLFSRLLAASMTMIVFTYAFVNIGMVIGEPLDFSRYRGLDKDRYVLRAITDEIMYNLMLLSGQEYVDLYAADVKAQLAAEGAFEGPVPSNGRPAPGGRTAPDVPVPTAPEEEPSEEENKEGSSK